MSPFPSLTINAEEISIELGDEQQALILRTVNSLNEIGTNIFWYQVTSHTAMMKLGVRIPKIQDGGKWFPLEMSA